MNKKIITLESNKYELKLDNFEGPLDLLVYLIDKNKMDIYKVNLSEIADQYIDYLRVQEELNLEIASEFRRARKTKYGNSKWVFSNGFYTFTY